jgi:hypothetical protein
MLGENRSRPNQRDPQSLFLTRRSDLVAHVRSLGYGRPDRNMTFWKVVDPTYAIGLVTNISRKNQSARLGLGFENSAIDEILSNIGNNTSSDREHRSIYEIYPSPTNVTKVFGPNRYWYYTSYADQNFGALLEDVATLDAFGVANANDQSLYSLVITEDEGPRWLLKGVLEYRLSMLSEARESFEELRKQNSEYRYFWPNLDKWENEFLG